MKAKGKETVYWLRVISRTNKHLENEANTLINEGNELVAIVLNYMQYDEKQRITPDHLTLDI
jgi:hypothetical protein